MHTRENHAGKPPSRAQAQVKRDTDAILARLTAKEMTNNPVTMAVVALTDPVTSWIMTMMGKPELKASSIDPIVKSITITMIYARTPLRAIVQNRARGTACLALRTSSLMCSAPSNPDDVSWTNRKILKVVLPVKLHAQVSIPRFQLTNPLLQPEEVDVSRKI
jgi:hypothetical protein